MSLSNYLQDFSGPCGPDHVGTLTTKGYSVTRQCRWEAVFEILMDNGFMCSRTKMGIANFTMCSWLCGNDETWKSRQSAICWKCSWGTRWHVQYQRFGIETYIGSRTYSQQQYYEWNTYGRRGLRRMYTGTLWRYVQEDAQPDFTRLFMCSPDDTVCELFEA